jgi:hypothetical protein
MADMPVRVDFNPFGLDSAGKRLVKISMESLTKETLQSDFTPGSFGR